MKGGGTYKAQGLGDRLPRLLVLRLPLTLPGTGADSILLLSDLGSPSVKQANILKYLCGS